MESKMEDKYNDEILLKEIACEEKNEEICRLSE